MSTLVGCQQKNTTVERDNVFEDTQKDINLYFTPYGKKGDTVSVEIIDIIDPAYDVTEGEKEDIIKDFQSGLKYYASYIYGISIAMKADGINYETDFYHKYSKKIIPDKDRVTYSMDEDAEFPADTMDDKHYTIVNGTIDTSGLEKGRHTVFAVCGNGGSGISSFVLEVQ